MNRTIVEVVKIRIRDIVPGDVVNKDPGATHGWFDVVELRRLHDGSVTVASRVAQLSFSGYPDDIVGLQVLESRAMPDGGGAKPAGRPASTGTPAPGGPSERPPAGSAAPGAASGGAPRPPAAAVPAGTGTPPTPAGVAPQRTAVPTPPASAN